jgi:DNA-binding IclR family transcriptional regulator
MGRVERSMRILEFLVREPEGARVTDLAVALGLNRAIPHRILANLCELGYVVQDPTTERYRATFKLGSLGLRQLEIAGISRWARDELEILASSTKELVRLGVVSGDSLLLVAKAQGADWGLMLDTVSRSASVPFTSANARAWLSTLPEEEALQLLASRGLGSSSVPTAATIDQVVESIARARRIGYVVIQEELEVGVNAIAVPIVLPDSPGCRAVGTLSVAGPSARVSPEVLVSFLPALRVAAERLGGQWHVYDYLVALSGPHAGEGMASADPGGPLAVAG